mgnify:CR=1 FL=1
MDFSKMKHIQCQIDEELEGACDYIDCAYAWKDEDMEWAEMYRNMAKQEMDHMNMLHMMAVREIKKVSGTPEYEVMKNIYNYLHERLMEKADKVQRKISEF